METVRPMEEERPMNYMLLDTAIGTIEAGPDQQERLDEFTERITDDTFYAIIAQLIPSQCIDGRPGAEGFAPNAAGGTESLMVADDLTFKRFNGASTLESYGNVINFLQGKGHPVGGHTDGAASAPASGCGANDRLPQIYAFLAQNGDMIRSVASTLGVIIDDETHATIIANAEARTEYSPGSELLTTLATSGEATVDVLEGGHKEVTAVMNKRPGTTLNRTEVQKEFGPDYQSFNADLWSFVEGAAAIAEQEAHISALTAGITYYNLAVANVLGGPKLRVIVRE